MPSGLPNLNFLMKEGNFELHQYGIEGKGSAMEINKDNIFYYRMETSPGMNGCPIFFGVRFIGIHFGGDGKRRLNGGRLFD